MQAFNFIDIFTSSVIFKDGGRLRVNKIVIPIIQRDYAQGRNTSTIRRVRKNFLTALYNAVTKKPITLDFIYGELSDDGTLTPLDGQQRLTTLFLLHWYAAKKDKINDTKTSCLNYFSYETRPDSRDFCKELVKSQPNFNKKSLSEEIKDQAWFPLSWKKDPTVNAMLKMLDAINEKFSNVKNLWRSLENNAISFYFMPIKDMGLTDEIYITMNSRGKLLTDFEHFKAEFKGKLDTIDAKISNRIIRKIDIAWTDMLWKYRDDKNLIDSGFLNYFKFLCDIKLYQNSDTPQGKARDSFSLIDEFFTGDNKRINKNIEFMERAFDCWCDIDIGRFFEGRVIRGNRNRKIDNIHQSGKIMTYFDKENLFEDCVTAKNFSLGKTVMLYAFIFYLLNKDNISDADFRRRIRIINNLVNNSGGSELSDSENRQGGNRIPAMLSQIESILMKGVFLKGIGPNFNDYQLKEEEAKLNWTIQNPNDAELLFELEDNYLLYGQIGIVDFNDIKNAKRFISLFECDYDLVDCAILARGDYYQYKGKIYQFGSKMPRSWQNLFHYSSYNENFDDTKEYLNNLLGERENFTNKYLEQIIAEHIKDCERRQNFEWNYYYIKYKVFRPDRYGKYFWQDFDNEPYLLTVYWTEKRASEKAYQPFLKAIVDESDFELRYNSALSRLEFSKYCIECENDAYVIRNIETNELVDRLKINQNNGVDTEDRILKFINWNKQNLYGV